MRNKVLIVDDNPLEIEYLKRNVDWEKLEFEICAVAYNGKRGLLMYEKYHPDLVIADIQMPGMTGIEMATSLREQQQDVCIAFLSSYEIFEYAKSGFELGVVQYILKQDIGTPKVQSALQKIKQEIENKKKLEYHIRSQKLRKWLDQLIEKDEEESEKKEIDKVFCTAVLFHDESLPFFPFQRRYLTIKSHEFLGLETYLMEKEIDSVLYTESETILFWQENQELSLGEKNRRAREKCEDLLKRSQDFSKYQQNEKDEILKKEQIRICLLGTELTEMKLKKIIEKRKLFDQRFLVETGSFFKYQGTENQIKDCVFCIQEEKTNRKEINWKIIELYEKQENIDELYRSVTECTEDLITCRKMGILFKTISILFQRYEEIWKNLQKSQGKIVEESQIFSSEEIYQCDTVKKAVKLWQKKYKILEEEKEKNIKKRYSKLTQEIMAYIQKHYWEKDLDVSQIAENISMSASRMRFVFKEETGRTIGQYITEFRMGKAKKLLLETKKKSDDIADEIGYLDGKYFRRIFKQKYGLTPKEYREKDQEEK